MVRPCCRRRVGMSPQAKCFIPTHRSVRTTNCEVIALDELEALRLADLMGFYHEEAAEEMGVSRATFGRIVEEARRKIADALVNGKALLIEGGNTEMKGEHEMSQRDGTGPVSEGKGLGLGPCGCGERRGHGPHRTAGHCRRRGTKQIETDEKSNQEQKNIDDDEKESKT